MQDPVDFSARACFFSGDGAQPVLAVAGVVDPEMVKEYPS